MVLEMCTLTSFNIEQAGDIKLNDSAQQLYNKHIYVNGRRYSLNELTAGERIGRTHLLIQ
jgi:hypothetical protein